jgi:hypothetical protein
MLAHPTIVAHGPFERPNDTPSPCSWC